MPSIVDDEKRFWSVMFKKIEYSSFEGFVRLLTWNRISPDLVMVKVRKDVP